MLYCNARLFQIVWLTDRALTVLELKWYEWLVDRRQESVNVVHFLLETRSFDVVGRTKDGDEMNTT